MPKKSFTNILKSNNLLSKKQVNKNILKNDELKKDVLEVEELKSKQQFCTKLKENIKSHDKTIEKGINSMARSLAFTGLSFTSGMPIVQSLGTVVGATATGIHTMQTGAAAGMKFINSVIYNKLECDQVLNEPSKKVDNAKYI